VSAPVLNAAGNAAILHTLKCWAEHFDAILDGRKRADIRAEEDRKFVAGDMLELVRTDREGKPTVPWTTLRIEVLHVDRHAGPLEAPRPASVGGRVAAADPDRRPVARAQGAAPQARARGRLEVTDQEIAELYVEELGIHPARHGLELYLSKGYSFGRVPLGTRGPKLSSRNAPSRSRLQARGPSRIKSTTSPNRLVNSLRGARLIVAEMRRQGASPADVQRWVVRCTTFTLRQVFQACSDEFEIVCYAAAV